MSILNTPMRDNDAVARTLGEYLGGLFRKVWREEQGFNGKRPWGNSNWQYDVYYSLADAGIMDGIRDVYDEGGPDEYISYDFDGEEIQRIDRLIEDTIREAFEHELL